jgi:hypothetical protein
LYKKCKKAIEKKNVKIKFETNYNLPKNPQESSRFDTCVTIEIYRLSSSECRKAQIRQTGGSLNGRYKV